MIESDRYACHSPECPATNGRQHFAAEGCMGPPHMGQTWPALGEHLAGGLIIDSSVWSRPIIAIKAARQALVEQSQVFGQKLFLVSVLCVPRKTLWEQGPDRRGKAHGSRGDAVPGWYSGRKGLAFDAPDRFNFPNRHVSCFNAQRISAYPAFDRYPRRSAGSACKPINTAAGNDG